jgi:hypothetical protein
MRKAVITLLVLVSVVGIGLLMFRSLHFEYAYTPPCEKSVNNEQRLSKIQSISSDEEAGTEKQIDFGKEMFFKDSFGNEVFFSDIMGLFDGPFTIANITEAILKLNGEGTSNLKVEAAQSFKSGDISIKKGDVFETGLDVAKGSYIPLGIKFVVDEGRVKAGVSCAACHASVDQKGNVQPGAPNNDLNIGLTLAMATNSSAYFSHTELESIRKFIKETDVNKKNGKNLLLPDKDELEKFVDSELIKWPRGSNDTTIDFKNNPVQIPDTFTLGDHPYGWSGQGQIGPFKGLSAAINNAHSQNMDAVSQSEISLPVLGIDKELYLGTLLQNSSNKKYRYDNTSSLKPSEFFASVDPTPGTPGVNKLVKAATYPKISFLSSIGMLPGDKGRKVWEEINAMSAYMNTLFPPKTQMTKVESAYKEGERVFSKAGCISCHAGQYFTKNIVMKVEDIGTDPSRAGGFKKTELYFSDPKIYSQDTPIPLPKNPKKKEIKLSDVEKESLKIAWAHGDSNGGYKIPSLYGLYFSAPYLHDGGVAVGNNHELGMPNTLMNQKKANPNNSLRALIDSNLRQKVIEANLASEKLKNVHVTGKGHEFWVDETTGFTDAQQDALIHYLLTLTDK